MASPTPNSQDDELIDITHLLRSYASECLSYSRPFAPPSEPVATTSPSASREDVNLDGILQVQGISLGGVNSSTSNATCNEALPTPAVAPLHLDLRDAMTALELGDKRMDCCEIPLISETPTTKVDSASDETKKHQPLPLDTPTVPPRIAPTSLSDGTPFEWSTNEASSPPSTRVLSNNTLLLQHSPCPSLLPYWETLSLSSSNNSPTSSPLLPLLLLQLTSLEAYIGTNNGGSNAAETLYCMMWCHDGVLVDMSERLNVRDRIVDAAVIDTSNVSKGDVDATNDLTVAQWALFASSLGIVRISEAVRTAVVNADIYEEEDFGVALHGAKVVSSQEGEASQDNTQAAKEVTTMRFCPSLKSDYHMINNVWSTAISKLQRYQISCSNEETDHTIDALLLILQYQQSFYRAIYVLSELNDGNVIQFTEIAVDRSREVVELLGRLRSNDAIADYLTNGLVETDGQLRKMQHKSSTEKSHQQRLDLFLAASFDPFVNRRLLGNAPVRKACFHQQADVIDSLSNLAAELEWAVCDVILHGNTLGRITRMMENISLRGCGGAVVVPPKKSSASKKKDESDKPPVGINVLCRSLLVLNLYFDDKLLGQYDFQDIIGE